VIGICCLEPMNLRLLVGGAAVATYIYTPFLKRLLVVKNVIVAAIIASSILAGGLVAGQSALRPASNSSHRLMIRSLMLGDGFDDLENGVALSTSNRA
jgi:4-hydroxybenzoate polyprenyltransferase